MQQSGLKKNSKTSRSFLKGRSPPSFADILASRQAERMKSRQDKTIQVVKPYSPHRPSQKQETFLRLDAEEIFYGGAAGGGKSDALILAALQYVDVPQYSAALFRQTEEDLYKPGAIGARARDWFTGTAAKWEDKGKLWRFPSYSSLPGATIHLGFARTKKEMETRYQGPEFQFIGAEELGQWEEDAYLYLWTRMRRLKGHQVPIRMRAAGNPGGKGAEWIRRRFIESALQDGTGMTVRELVALKKRGGDFVGVPVFRSPPSAQAIAVAKEFGRQAQGACFVPAYARDNPGLDVAEYMQNLARVDPATRDQLEHGDWWAAGGGDFFKAEWFKYADEAPKNIRWIRVWDLAATAPHEGNLDPDWTAGTKMGVQVLDTGSNMIWIAHCRRFREEPGDVEKGIRAIAESDGRKVPIYIEEEGGSSGKNTTANYASKVLFGWKVHGERKTGSKINFWEPLAADAQNGLVTLVRGEWTVEFVNELCQLKLDMSHGHDDQADSAGLGRAKLLDSTGLQRLRAWAKSGD